MRRKLIVALFVIIFLTGLSVMLYPMVSDLINSQKQSDSVKQYFQVVESLSQQDFTEMFEAARQYNERLPRKPSRFSMTDDEQIEYRSLLNPAGLGAMGTLEIEILDIHLTIFHGTDEGVLQIALGHLEGSSFPVGGPGTHAVITGHRGLPSSTLLTNLDRLVIGDTFKINVLNETLIYRVDQTLIVEPHEMTELAIVPDADLCTLVTCTPYGINTHRLLVRGVRVESGGETFERPAQIPSGARVLTGARASLLLIIPAMVIVLAILFIRLRRVYGRGNKQ